MNQQNQSGIDGPEAQQRRHVDGEDLDLYDETPGMDRTAPGNGAPADWAPVDSIPDGEILVEETREQ